MVHHPVLARIYDVVMVPGDRLGLEKVRRRAVADARGRVVEVGTGTGLLLPHYRAADEVHALDPDPLMLRRARRRARASPVPVRLLRADGMSLPFRDAAFDTGVVALALCTIPDPLRALAELRRVVRPAGELRFVEHVLSLRPAAGAWQRRLAPAWRRLAGGCRLDQDTVALIEASGWEVASLWRSGEGEGWIVSGRAR